ncbi:MAG: peptidoglycan-binding domain-containing protein [Patescibacteria group bacterium]
MSNTPEKGSEIKALSSSFLLEEALEAIDRFGSLEQGKNSNDVKSLQEILKFLGYFKKEPKGNFGPATTKAVIEFKTANGISIDSERPSIVGFRTRAKLKSALSVLMSAYSSPELPEPKAGKSEEGIEKKSDAVEQGRRTTREILGGVLKGTAEGLAKPFKAAADWNERRKEQKRADHQQWLADMKKSLHPEGDSDKK